MGVASCKIVFLGGHFLFTCSDIFAIGSFSAVSFSHNAQRHRRTDRQTDRQTDVIIMTIADHTACRCKNEQNKWRKNKTKNRQKKGNKNYAHQQRASVLLPSGSVVTLMLLLKP